MSGKSNQQYQPDTPLTFGLDIGIASVGWAVLAPNRIINLGVRAFNKAETAKEGESLNLGRRNARLLRRRLRRRAWRLTKLARFLKRNGVIENIADLKGQPNFFDSTFELRVASLNRLLSPIEFARVLYHLCKHRGFHWVSKAEAAKAEGDGKSEGGKVKQGLSKTASLMTAKDYRTAAEMLVAEFPEAQRNKRGDYGKAISRVLLADEITQIFKAQSEFGNVHATTSLSDYFVGPNGQRTGLFWAQKPSLSGEALLKMLGKCTFEKEHFRAPKSSFSAERHVWLTRLNNLRIQTKDGVRGLTGEERQSVIDLPYASGEKFEFKTLRKGLVKGGLPDDFRFASLRYPNASNTAATKIKDPETEIAIKLTGWHALRLAMKNANLTAEWDQISYPALEGNSQSLDQISWVLSVYKDDAEIETELAKLKLPGGQKTIDTLSLVSFDKFHSLSLKALYNIVPLMAQGMRYDEAVAAITDYKHHSQLFKPGDSTTKLLPPLYSMHRDKKTGAMVLDPNLDLPRNPVVLRAINQARKVVNALVQRYGSPSSVHIEVARDLSKPFDERRSIEKDQKAYRETNEKTRETFSEEFGRRPTGREFEKWLLYREQQGKCVYSLEPLDLNRVIDDLNYAQIDHVLPYSRSYDDSKSNRVLVLTRENQNKGNRTPFEYLDGANASQRWRHFEQYVQTNHSFRNAKQQRMLRKHFAAEDAEEFRERNLNDTRYICRFFKNYVEQYLKLAEGSTARRCVVVNGQLTNFLRLRWGLTKDRAASDRHHALDAVVIAACSHAMVKRLADYSKNKELEFLRTGFADPETGEIINPTAYSKLADKFPLPWQHFRDELHTRLLNDDVNDMRTLLTALGSYSEVELQNLKPLFVSRAPQRRNLGAAHKETIYSQPEKLRPSGNVIERVALAALSIADLGRLVDPHRNERLYSAIRERLNAFGGKGDKAFTAGNPLYKPDTEGNPTGPVVRSVRLVINSMTGVALRGGLAKNDSMVRVDVFNVMGKYYLVPVYVHHLVSGIPNRGIVQSKPESEWATVSEEDFIFSLYPNDYVRIRTAKETIVGYYGGCDRATGAISIWAHDRAVKVGKDGLIRGIGVRSALEFASFSVDVLGSVFPSKPEPRDGLALRSN